MAYRRAWAARPWVPGAVLLLLIVANEAPAGEAYFVLVFGSQRDPNLPAHSHSFAAFVHASWEGPAIVSPRLEVVTISWLPANLHIRSLALLPECGRNFDLHTTLRWALNDCQRVSLWGPYQIDRDLYLRALAQFRLLESGQVQYKAGSTARPSDQVSNCVHAVESVLDGYRPHLAILPWGERASYRLLQEMQPWILGPCQVHPWVASALGLGAYPIVYRPG